MAVTRPKPTPPPRAPDPQAAETALAHETGETLLSLSPGGEPARRDPAEPPVDSLALAKAASGRSFDRLLARLIVEKGLATQDEVDACMPSVIGSLLARRKSFSERLIERRAITPNQLARLQESVESRKAARTIPGFKMLGKLGKGTTATVYKARQLNLDRLVAVKVLPSATLQSSKAVDQFYFEGRSAAKLNHPNIVQAFDVGHTADFHYFVMEYVEGLTVHEILGQRGTVEQQEALEIVIAMADALRHAHEKGLVHRDVKPKNIIVDPKGVAKLADLGLARVIADREAGLAEKGHALGTPYYISPEQVRGEVEIGPAADVYSLGATFYHMVTGMPPFTGVDAREVMNKHLHEKVRPPIELIATLNPGLSEVIEKMLAKAPSDRYTDCELLLADLQAWKAVFTLAKGERETGRA